VKFGFRAEKPSELCLSAFSSDAFSIVLRVVAKRSADIRLIPC
jgi:hypothetical protein